MPAADAARDARPLAGPPLTATYRLQLHAGFTFDDARRLLPYLQRLGVSHVYLSPVLAARPGSTHGYDVVDPTRANPALGGEAGFAALAVEVHQRGMGLVVDLVPNHMGAGPANPYWMDVVALGRESPYARWFDVDWRASHARGRLVLPVLGDPPEEVLARGELYPALEGDRFVVRYFDHVFPLDPRTVQRLFAFTHTYAFPPAAREDALAWEEARGALLPSDGGAPGVGDATAAVRAIAELAARSPTVRGYVDWVLDVFGAGEDGRHRMSGLLDAQRWRLAHWRQTSRELHFRRFFDVTELVAVRIEDPAVFAAYHAWTLERVARGWIDAVRVDHVDGLRDPHAYLAMLRAALDARRPDAHVPVFVEKILAHDEPLRTEWPIDGTTGYEALNTLERALVDPAGAQAIERAYRRLLRTRASAGFAPVAERGKEHVLRTTFRPELRQLVSLLVRVARALGVDAPAPAISEALLQLATALPVYRTYLREDPTDDARLVVDAEDRRLLDAALAHAIARGVARPDVLRFVGGVLLGHLPTDVPLTVAARRAARDAALRFQQVSGPATAKGIEDTALYRWFPLASLNEVGSEPALPLDDAVAELHEASAVRATRWPRTLVTVTTHDTKRTADVRARLDALSELPGEWSALVARWHRRHAPLRTRVGRRLAPDANTEYLLYQTLVGVWPEPGPTADPAAPADAALVARVEEYLRKAMREAKAQSSWTQPNAAFEDGVLRFASALLRDEAGVALRRELAQLLARVGPAGRWTSLTRTTLQIAGAGTPDVYQGDEMWMLALVDPDNRRPVDWAERKLALMEREAAARDAAPLGSDDAARLLADARDGTLKLHVVRALLHARRRDPALFAVGRHVPLAVHGTHAAHVIAFARVLDDRVALVIVPRLTLALAADGGPPVGAVWDDTTVTIPDTITGVLGGRALQDVVSGRALAVADTLRVARVLANLPVACAMASA